MLTNMRKREYDEDERASIRERFQDLVNMGPVEFDRWAEDPCSQEASVNRRPIERLRRLLGKPMGEWTDSDYEDAAKVVSFISRMREVANGDPVSDDCPLSARDISLLNWGYDPRKAMVIGVADKTLILMDREGREMVTVVDGVMGKVTRMSKAAVLAVWKAVAKGRKTVVFLRMDGRTFPSVAAARAWLANQGMAEFHVDEMAGKYVVSVLDPALATGLHAVEVDEGVTAVVGWVTAA